MLNATWIETFTILAEEGHFTRAAARLNMTQPGVSQHLRKLEQQLGQPLISQDGKSFTLTAAGEALRDVGLSRRTEEKALRESISRDDPDAGELRLACSGSFAMLFYPRAIALMRDAPELSIHVEAVPQPRVLEGVLEGRFDLGVVADDPGHPRIEARHIGQEELCLLLPAGRDGPVGFNDLETLGLVAHPDVASYANDLLARNFPEAFTGADRLRLRTYVNQIGQIPAPVAEGLGYTLLPRSGLAAFPRADRIRVAPLPEPRFNKLWSIRHRGRAPSARLQRIMGVVEALAATLG
ncbi:LysR family transcriptional regulator [Pseudooceanicola algae]|uniref:HTH-type transcriptional regulator ArgP n=1 Tax=Pseudooceanicola algae TaxID=1537215 RepID=A0A418SKA0_9RHOB|nr:LysR family transcriptional regulator [Pseudooceanicola algae]QPM89168.1 HTH-type transcriptional regulator ArgP [Pseudooceanicola algae]